MSERAYSINNPDGIYFVTFSVVNWIDIFVRQRYKDIIVESLKYCQTNKGLEIFGWCLISSHIHLIIRAKEGYNLSDILRDFKKFTSSRLIKSISDTNEPESRREWMLWMFQRAAKKNSRNTNYQLWQQNNHPEELFSDKFLHQKLNYIHNNPVVEGIVEDSDQYLYSSARNYQDEKGLIEVIFI